MDCQRSPLISWAFLYCQGKSMEELRHSLLCTTVELETTRVAAQEELRKRDDQLIQLRELLDKATRERDEAQDKYQKLFLEKLLIQQQQLTGPLSGVSSVEDEPRRGIDSNAAFSSSDSDESIVSSPPPQLTSPRTTPLPPQQPPPLLSQVMTVVPHNSTPDIELVPDKPLPEKGKLLQAVMKAGPLLQTLLLAGPLPQWRHPPPPLDSFEIPPVTIPSPPQHLPPSPMAVPPLLLQDSLAGVNACSGIAHCGRLSRKRGHFEGSDSPTEPKYQRVLLN
ncbi:arp2/3 complex-activating protein rickA-like [Rhodamnia argentea]|uniref:Arp2/3 complex-activating protein rickA-like n=1 Tax=Rhodamnia argentea TaxID=178133 RepID=A0A8B8NEG0_9MYRT|nr:arp2/3 complex-activating protein rickA-like [Rhodamnia argentea]